MTGLWGSIISFIFETLKFIYGFVGDWGLAIIVVTLAFRVLMWPLMTKSTRSMRNMQKIQPLMKEIQTKYADDKERQAEEMRKLQAEHNVNPLSGCLPMLLPMPLLIAFYQVLAAPTVKDGLITKVGPLASFLGYEVGGTFTAGAVVRGSFLGIIPDIMLSPSGAMVDGLWVALPYFVLLAIFGLSLLLPSMMQQFPDAAQAKQQKTMGYTMAVMMLFVGYNIPAGALLYYGVSSLLGAGQQFLTQQAMKREEAAAEELVVEAKNKKKKNKKTDNNNSKLIKKS